MVCEHSQSSLTIQTIKLSKISTFIFLSITFFFTGGSMMLMEKRDLEGILLSIMMLI